MNSTDFQDRLLAWYRKCARELPWRSSCDPYSVLVSEFMLQQTTVAVVVPRFERWMDTLPTFEALSHATEDVVMGLWQGLGYYRRARSLHQAARQVVAKGLPQTLGDWRGLPGVGRYTAAAVASITQGCAAPLVDGNVERVFTRLKDHEAEGLELNRAAWRWAESVLVHEAPGDWNQALMELGATVCRPQSPLCFECPVQSDCQAHARGTVALRPTPRRRAEPVEVRFHVIVVEREGAYAVRRVPTGDWWQGLWEFPRVEDPQGELPTLGTVRTVVTRHRVVLEVYRGGDPGECVWLGPDEVEALPLSSPMRRVWAMARQRESTSRTTGNTTLPSSR